VFEPWVGGSVFDVCCVLLIRLLESVGNNRELTRGAMNPSSSTGAEDEKKKMCIYIYISLFTAELVWLGAEGGTYGRKGETPKHTNSSA
jgi:hypothetical protein